MIRRISSFDQSPPNPSQVSAKPSSWKAPVVQRLALMDSNTATSLGQKYLHPQKHGCRDAADNDTHQWQIMCRPAQSVGVNVRQAQAWQTCVECEGREEQPDPTHNADASSFEQHDLRHRMVTCSVKSYKVGAIGDGLSRVVGAVPGTRVAPGTEML